MHTVVMPKMGDTMEEGKIITWRKHEGDTVAKGDALAEIETEKVNIEAEAFAAGTLRKILAPEGATIPVGQPIALIGAPNEAIPAEFGGAPSVATAAPATAAPAAPSAPRAAPSPQRPPRPTGGSPSRRHPRRSRQPRRTAGASSSAPSPGASPPSTISTSPRSTALAPAAASSVTTWSRRSRLAPPSPSARPPRRWPLARRSRPSR